MNKKRALDLIILLLAAVMLFSGYKLFTIHQDNKQVKEQYEQLEQMVQNPQTEEDEDTYVTSQQKYQSIYEQNNDFAGWLYIPDTELSYPVMHTPSNPEYYLRKSFDKEYSIHGVPFVDYRCIVDQSDNTIIYGHNMMNGTMFGVLENYKNKDYWQQHRYIGFDTMNGYGKYEVAICGRIDLLTTEFDYLDGVDFATQEDFDSYIANAQACAYYETDIKLCYGDKLILLSTCETNNDNGRYIIIAKKVSEDSLDSVKK